MIVNNDWAYNESHYLVLRNTMNQIYLQVGDHRYILDYNESQSLNDLSAQLAVTLQTERNA